MQELFGFPFFFFFFFLFFCTWDTRCWEKWKDSWMFTSKLLGHWETRTAPRTKTKRYRPLALSLVDRNCEWLISAVGLFSLGKTKGWDFGFVGCIYAMQELTVWMDGWLPTCTRWLHSLHLKWHVDAMSAFEAWSF